MPDLRSSPSRLRLCAFLIVLAALLVASERVAWPNRPPLLDGRMLFGLWGVLLAGVTLVRPAPGSFGLGAGNPKHGLAALVLGLPVAVAGMAAFARVGSISAHYGAHPPEPLALLGLYAPGIVQVEVCFRGVIQFTLGRYLGATEAICLATIPYALVHLDKPTSTWTIPGA